MTSNPRFRITLQPEDYRKVNELARQERITAPRLIRQWLNEYVRKGTDLTPPKPGAQSVEVQVVATPQELKAAKERAEKDGLALREIIAHRIRNS